VLLAVLSGVAVADIHSFDCPMKQLGLNFVQTIQPFLELITASLAVANPG
jgi:hypothetical protein